MFKCDICGRELKTENALKLHRRACEKKQELNNKQELIKTEENKEKGLIKTEPKAVNNKEQEIIDILNNIKGGRVTVTNGEKLLSYYSEITGKPKLPLDCSTCITEAIIVLRKKLIEKKEPRKKTWKKF